MSRAAALRAPARIAANVSPGAKPARFPGFVEPCHPTLRDEAPSGGGWVHEIKFDGYRTQAHLKAGRPAIYTRRGHDWTVRFHTIADVLTRLRATELILDGEAVVADSRGIPDFGLLHADLAAGRQDRLLYYAFDLLYLDGLDLRGAALAERKRVLSQLLTGASERILYAEHLEGDGSEIHEHACAMGLEGIISKQQDAPYRSGRTESWIKVKCGKRDSFPIVAFVEKLGATPRKIASFYVGRREGDRLLYAGKVRGGFTEAEARDLRERLDPLIRKEAPLTEPINKPKATWVEPVIEAEVAYSTLTEHQLLREAVFKGVREDRDSPASRARGRPVRSEGRQPKTGVPAENILQLLPDAVPPSKDELAAYWTKVWKRALLHLGRRPLKLVRHVRSTTFYHMGRLPPVSEAVHRLTIEKREGGEGTRLWVDDLDGLLGLIEIGAVELHPWNANIDDIENPDMLVFDLDPGEGVAWDFVIETALTLRRMLRDEGLKPWPKLTGGKGLHLMAPLDPKINDDQARAYAKRIAQRLAATAPDRYTLFSDPRQRTGHLHRLPTERPRHDGHRYVVAASAAWIPDCGPGELVPGRERDPSGRLFYPEAAGQMRWHSGGPATHERPPSRWRAHPLKSSRPYNIGCPPVTGTTAPDI
jgi:bifunctional non-homologous end joining protein LigD